MAYKQILSADEFIEDISNRKEFQQFKQPPDYNFRQSMYNDILDKKRLKLMSYQLFVKNFMNPNTPYKRLLLKHSTGSGKCLGKDTPILMYDGTIKMVQDIIVGDLLMGDDSSPRTILSLARGTEQLYSIYLLNDMNSFVCNESHILCLKQIESNILDTYVNISVKDYLKRSKYYQQIYQMYRSDYVRFQTKPIDINPYIFGYWLGSKQLYNIQLHSKQIIDYFKNIVIMNGNIFSIYFDLVFKSFLQQYNLLECKYIPNILKCNSKHIRLEVLAGLIDIAGKVINNKYILTLYNEKLVNDIVFLSKSLGFNASINYFNNKFYEITISGYAVPTLLESNKIKIDKYSNTHLMTEFNLKKIEVGNYYGFEIDGNRKFILGDFTVTHNTISAIIISLEFIKMYKLMYDSVRSQIGGIFTKEFDRQTPSVFIIGFSRKRFISDLLKFPELGFISSSERIELDKLRSRSEKGAPDDIKRYKEQISLYRKRLIHKQQGGFFKFYGYQELVNRLFTFEQEIESKTKFDLTTLESYSTRSQFTDNFMSVDDLLKKYISNNKITVNHQLLESFKNSLIVCDEIHNVYNTEMKNNWGISIQYILDLHPSTRGLFMSATPINNSPTEVIDILNLLLTKDEKIYKKEFFEGNRKLRPGKLEEIGRLSIGKISFLQDSNIKYYPKRIFIGETVKLALPISNLNVLPYLKFIKCPMSELHQKTYNNLIQQRIMPIDGYYIYDMVFPNPSNKELGLFRSSQTRIKLLAANQTFKDKHKINIHKVNQTYVISGQFLNKKNICKYTTKYHTLLTDILQLITDDGKTSNGDKIGQKIMIFHPRVRMSGVLLIQELLKENGVIDEYSEPVQNTLCSICGKIMNRHAPASIKHLFKPVRFVIIHSDIDVQTREQSFIKFNSPDNAHGSNYKILIGSKVIRESVEMKDVQNLFFATIPTNISTFIQVLGRCIRKGSHINLPSNQWIVKVKVYLSTINCDIKYDKIEYKNISEGDISQTIKDKQSIEKIERISEISNKVSLEEQKYAEKLSDFIVIQQIEKVFNENAIDADIHKDIIMSDELIAQYFPDGRNASPVSTIDPLYFEPKYSFKPNELNLSTFNAYEHSNDEVINIVSMIKRLFIRQPVWTYEDLLKNIKNPQFGTEINPQLLSENNFIIALDHLCTETHNTAKYESLKHKTDVKNDIYVSEGEFVEKIFDYNDRFIYIRNDRGNIQKYKIGQVAQFYIMFPINDTDITESGISSQIRDIDSFIRPKDCIRGVRICIDTYINEAKINKNYKMKKNDFKKKYCGEEDLSKFLGDFSNKFHIKLIREIICHKVLNTKINNELCKLYDRVIKLFDSFAKIIYIKDVRKNKGISKQFKSNLSKLSTNIPIGYITYNSIALYDNKRSDDEDKRWFEISQASLNKQYKFRENNNIIGYYETGNDNKIKFKLRKPIDDIKKNVDDIRLIERGIVCNTKSKTDLIKISNKLNIKLDIEHLRVKTICDEIRIKLLNLEIKERQKGSRIKYFYIGDCFDRQPSFSS